MENETGLNCGSVNKESRTLMTNGVPTQAERLIVIAIAV